MSHDFAKQKQAPTRGKRRMPAVSRSQPAADSHWGWFFSGFFLGIVAVAVAWFGLLRLDELRTTTNDTAASSVEVPAPTMTFDFYSSLANSEVAVSTAPGDGEPLGNTPDAPAPVARNQTQSDSQIYLVQAGSFLNRQDAENLRANLILLNLNSSISTGLVNGRTVYRVQVGPFTGRRNAEDTREILADNGIVSILIRPL